MTNGASANAGGGSRRLFAAVPVGAEVRRNLAALQDRLRRDFPRVKWVPPENIHLTLVFIGDVPAETVPVIAPLLGQAANTVPAFSCATGEAGLFGPARSPRIVWVGINEGVAPLLTLHQAVSERLRTLSITLETREFAPHLTIGRITSGLDAKGLKDILAAEKGAAYGTIAVDRVHLMRSELLPQGPRYTVLSEFRLWASA